MESLLFRLRQALGLVARSALQLTLAAAVAPALLAPAAAADSGAAKRYIVQGFLAPDPKSDTVQQTLEATFNPSQMQIRNPGSITYPAGWALQYQVDDQWVDTAPTDPGRISGLRTIGNVPSANVLPGSDNKAPLVVTQNRSIIASGAARTFAIPTGGDAWQAVLSPDGQRVFYMFHAATTLYCANRTAPGACPGWSGNSVQLDLSAASYRATAIVTPDGRVFVAGYRDRQAGLACIRSDGSACDSSFFPLTNNGLSYRPSTVEDMVLVDSRIYVFDNIQDRLLCFDTRIQAPCTDENGWQPPSPSGYDSFYYQRIMGDQSHVYGFIADATLAAVTLFCYDPQRKASCTGWEKGLHTDFVPFLLLPVAKAGDNAEMLCAIAPMATSGASFGTGGARKWSCFGADGSSAEPSATLTAAMLETLSSGEPQWNSAFLAHGRTYWTSIWDYYQGTIGCYDAAKDANCWSSANQPALPALYAVTPDPSLPGCIWAMSHSLGIQSYDSTGANLSVGCGTIPPNIHFKVGEIRLGCAPATKSSAWQSFSLQGALGATDARLTVFDSQGKAVPKWSNVAPGNGPRGRALRDGSMGWDLSGLPIAASGSAPDLSVALTGLASDTRLDAALTMTTLPPQLCWDGIAVESAGGIPKEDPRTSSVPPATPASSDPGSAIPSPPVDKAPPEVRCRVNGGSVSNVLADPSGSLLCSGGPKKVTLQVRSWVRLR